MKPLDRITLPPGRRIGPYLLANALAQGGMGRVHLAVRVGSAGFRRVVAVKRARPDLSSLEYQQMFRSEIDLMSLVVHPNVVAALDVVRVGRETLLVMEYVHGESLHDVLFRLRQTGSVVPPQIAATIVCDVLRGLHAIHETVSPSQEKLDLVHRDVAPDNIVIGAEGVSRILDFGIATASSRPGTTRVGYLKGKAPYLAPERLNDGRVDRRVDVYGAGVVLWEALTGRKLFDGEDAAIFSQVLAGGIAAPGSLIPGVSPELDAIALRALSTRAEDRFSTALDMVLALRNFCADPSTVAAWLRIVAGESLERRTAVVRDLMLTSSAEQTAVLLEVEPEWRASRWGLAAVVSVFAAAGAFTTWQFGGESTARANVPEPPAPVAIATVAPPAPVTSAAAEQPRQAREDSTEQGPPAKPRPARIKNSAPRRAQPQGIIDDGF